MLETFDDDARRIVLNAQREAKGLRYPNVDTSHLLLSLAGDHSTEPSRLLASVGVTYDRLWLWVVETTAIRTIGKATRQLRHTDEFRTVLNSSVRETEEYGSPDTTPAHVLSALLTYRSGVGRETIRALKVDLSELHRQTRALYRRT